MSQQIVNFAENIKEIIFENWTLKGRNDRLKFFWAGYKIQRIVFKNKKRLIEVTQESGTGDPKSPARTKLDFLFKLDIWMKLTDSTVKDAARVEQENDRALIKDEILKIIHNNQTTITGLKIATLTKFLDPDELDKPGEYWLHSSIFLTGQLFHAKT